MESYQLLLLRHKAVYLFTLCVCGGGCVHVYGDAHVHGYMWRSKVKGHPLTLYLIPSKQSFSPSWGLLFFN